MALLDRSLHTCSYVRWIDKTAIAPSYKTEWPLDRVFLPRFVIDVDASNRAPHVGV